MALLEHYIQVGKDRMRCGYTTGTCAAAAARGAAELLLCGRLPAAVVIETPAGIPVETQPLHPARGDGWASCAIRKDAGDDPDITDGALIYAHVQKTKDIGIMIDGGDGVGRVTRPGLDQPVGAAAINRVPREMINEQARAATKAHGYTGGLKIVISIPDGETLSLKTFNPRLGIEGGISVLGTGGIVRPMSKAAIIDTIRAELSMYHAAGRRDILVAPGNYGDNFSRGELGLSAGSMILCSNYIGECIDYAAFLGFRSMLVVGHIGKLIKVACGNFDTHSSSSDGRRETLTAHCALCGAGRELLQDIFGCATTDEAIRLLDTQSLRQSVMASIVGELEKNLSRRSGGSLNIQAVVFSNQYGILGKTTGAQRLLALHRSGKED